MMIDRLASVLDMESAWESAQTRLAQLRALSWTDGPSPRTIRVGQLDAELLDQELVYLLQEPISKALSSPRWKPELSLFIQLVLYKLSVWNTGATYGAKLQDLRYVVPPSSGSLSRACGQHRFAPSLTYAQHLAFHAVYYFFMVP